MKEQPIIAHGRLKTGILEPAPVVAPARRALVILSPSGDPLTPTIFHESWWLEIATGGAFDVVETRVDGRVVGRMPYALTRRFAFITASGMPTLTHFLGPAIEAGRGSATTRHLRRQSITRDLIRRLPRVLAFRQKFHAGITDMIPFQAERYETHVQFSFELGPGDAASIWRGMRDKTRNTIRGAMRDFTVTTAFEPAAFARLYTRNLERLRRTSYLDLRVCTALIEGACARGRGAVWAAHDAERTPVAAIVCVWDETTAYYVMSTRDPVHAKGAVSLLIWQAVQHAVAHGRVFDFDGLPYESLIHLYGGFGARVAPRYIASRQAQLRLGRNVTVRVGQFTNTFNG